MNDLNSLLAQYKVANTSARNADSDDYANTWLTNQRKYASDAYRYVDGNLQALTKALQAMAYLQTNRDRADRSHQYLESSRFTDERSTGSVVHLYEVMSSELDKAIAHSDALASAIAPILEHVTNAMVIAEQIDATFSATKPSDLDSGLLL